MDKRRFAIAILMIVIIASSVLSIILALKLFGPAPAYEFKTGINHTTENDYRLKNGTVVLYFSVNNCPPCDKMTQEMTDLQSHYTSTGVTVSILNYEDNTTSQGIFHFYEIREVPKVFVIRQDGAVAIFEGKDINMNNVKIAIEEAQLRRS